MTIAALIAAAALTTTPTLHAERFSDRASAQLRSTGFEDAATGTRVEEVAARRVYRSGAGAVAKDSPAYKQLLSKLANTARR
jgi:hypothetical protein